MNNTFTIGYILELENSKYYIGISDSVNFRLYCHFQGTGSRWTRTHKPIKCLELVPNADKLWEKTTTLDYMNRHGWENVRGGAWCQVNLKKPPRWLSVSSVQEVEIFSEENKDPKSKTPHTQSP